jgi:hypothetical protein
MDQLKRLESVSSDEDLDMNEQAYSRGKSVHGMRSESSGNSSSGMQQSVKTEHVGNGNTRLTPR